MRAGMRSLRTFGFLRSLPAGFGQRPHDSGAAAWCRPPIAGVMDQSCVAQFAAALSNARLLAVEVRGQFKVRQTRRVLGVLMQHEHPISGAGRRCALRGGMARVRIGVANGPLGKTEQVVRGGFLEAPHYFPSSLSAWTRSIFSFCTGLRSSAVMPRLFRSWRSLSHHFSTSSEDVAARMCARA